MAFNMLSNSRRHASVTMADIDAMGGLEFESFVGELLKDLGYTGVQVTKSTGDQGVDVVASKNGTKYAIQCKNYSSPLNNKPIQEVTTGKAVYGCDVCVVLTNSTFNQSAQEAAKATNTLLWDRNTLQKMLSQSKFNKPAPTMPAQTKSVPQTKTQAQHQNVNVSGVAADKGRSTFKFILRLILVGFNGLALFAGVVTLATTGFDTGDAGLFLFLLALFLIGLRLVSKNKKTKSSINSKNSYKEYAPSNDKRVGWGSVALCLFFCFPAGFYLLYKKMSQYADKEEMLRNSKTLNIWATILMILGLIYPFMSILGQMEFPMALVMFVCLFPYGFFLLKKAKGYQALYAGLPKETYPSAHVTSPVGELQDDLELETEVETPPASAVTKDRFSEFFYHANEAERTYVVIHCKGCNAPNRIVKGSVGECEYCGRPVNEDAVSNEVALDADEAAIAHAFAVIQRLLESLDEVSDDLNDSLDRLTLAMDTYPNRSLPLDVEMNRTGSSLNAFSAQAKRISAGIKAQVMSACDNLMGDDDESWEKVEEQLEQLNEIKSTMSESISGLRTFKHSLDTLSLNAGFRIKSAQMKLSKELDSALGVMQSSLADFSETLRIFRNAKFTSKTARIKQQKGRGI